LNHLPQSSSSSHTHLPQNSSSRCRHSCVEIPPKTRYKQKQNETHYENITHNINIYDKTALSQQNSDLRCWINTKIRGRNQEMSRSRKYNKNAMRKW
jgi:hypothetical protein